MADETSKQVIHCPACGYDLRGSSEGNCPECGGRVDRAALQVLLVNPPEAFGWTMLLAAILPVVVGAVSLILPRVDDLVPLWLAYVLFMGAMILFAAAKDAQHQCFKRVVVKGHPPSAGYRLLVFALNVVLLVGWASAFTAFGLVVGINAHL